MGQWPFSGKKWSFETNLSDMTQGLLFDSFQKNQGIHRILCEWAVRNNNAVELQDHLKLIVNGAITKATEPSFRNKISERMKCKVCLPCEVTPDDFEWTKWDAKIYNNNLQRMCEDAAKHLRLVYDAFKYFDFKTFIQTFEGDADTQVGYAWNSLNLFFLCGVQQKVYFPTIPSLLDKSLQDYIQDEYNEKHRLRRVLELEREFDPDPVPFRQPSESDSEDVVIKGPLTQGDDEMIDLQANEESGAM